MVAGHLDVSEQAIAAFCRRWDVAELSVFGSALRDDFRPDIDVDVLVHLGPGGGITFENLPAMQDELSALFNGRQIDLIEKRAVRNPFVRHDMLTHRQVIYAARAG